MKVKNLMKVRNLEFDKLNKIERQVVIGHYDEQHKIQVIEERLHFECEEHEECNTIRGFWESHREIDTDYGQFDGWLTPNKIRGKTK